MSLHATLRSTLVIGSVLLGACSGAEHAPALASIGELAPAYSATVLEGGTAAIADYRGQVVLLNVWATWCHPCREEIPYLQSLHDAHAARGLAIIGVSVDAAGSEGTIREFRTDFGMTYPIWLDPEEKVQSLFLALGVPASYLIDREGTLRWKHLGTVRATDTTFTRVLREALDDEG